MNISRMEDKRKTRWPGIRRVMVTLCLCGMVAGLLQAAGEAPHSLFAAGHWVGIQIPQEGIYKITYTELEKMGFADPAKVSVHGYGGWPLDEDFSRPAIDDIPATAVYRGNGYLLFFGKGPVRWQYDPASHTFIHTNNPYATYGCYFLTDAAGAKDMQSLPSYSSGASLVVSTYDEYRAYEQELVSVNESGRELYGESLAGGGFKALASPVFNIPGITDGDAKVTMRFIARPKGSLSVASLAIGGQNIMNLTIPAVGNSSDASYTKGIAARGTVDWTGAKNENLQVSVSYSKAGDENVHLDYIRLHVQRTLAQYGEYTFFRSTASVGNVSRFVLQGADANTVVFDVTDGLDPMRMETELAGSELSFTIPAGNLREFVAVQTNRTLGGWTSTGEVKNQDLHATGATDMVIIVQDGLLQQAERLAERHRKDNLRVEVATARQIYNEFSSGTPDATAYRRFMKMLYDRAATGEDRPRYLLLFGDGAYDNRKLTNEWKQVNTANMLLTYQSDNSLDQYSYVTDDYFGALGDWGFNTGPVQLGIGRFPVRTLAEATLVVDKVIVYMDGAAAGDWKNKLCFVADDGSASDGYSSEHAEDADSIAQYLRGNHPEFMVSKLYFDAFKKTGSAYPDIRSNIQKQLKDGLMMINYSGHGDTEKWSDESVLTSQDIARFTHTNLPLWITATCDFTRFDHTKTSAGENIFLQASGGIALLTTTRVVYARQNFNLNSRLIVELFRKDAGGRRPTLGDAMRSTKSALSDANKLNFILIGDPALRLAYPENQMQVTAINGQAVEAGAPISLKALEKVTVAGEVLSPSGSPLPDFSGTLNVTVFDSKQVRTTLNNNRVSDTVSFTDYPNRLFVGNDLVRNGKFEFSFTVPKDISYSNDYGLMNLYAAPDSQGSEAQGSFAGFTVGGSAEAPGEDAEGPAIRQLYLNDSTFTEGGVVNSTPLFVARLWDRTGVNIGGGSIGHDITLSIDNNPAQAYTLNSYYRLIPGSGGEGMVQFSLPALAEGKHTAEFRDWDVLNNPTVATFTFEVSGGLKPAITGITATPVPARTGVQFRIYHNMPETNLQLGLAVYDMAGKLQWQTGQAASSGSGAPLTIDWNLANNSGSRLRPGVYIYRVSLRSSNSGEASKSEKLLILAQ